MPTLWLKDRQTDEWNRLMSLDLNSTHTPNWFSVKASGKWIKNGDFFFNIRCWNNRITIDLNMKPETFKILKNYDKIFAILEFINTS